MDFSVIFQLRNKKAWWIDVIFYFVISLLIATVFCYIIFLTKNSFLRDDIKKETITLQTVGTQQQKDYEKDVINYRNKFNDFYELFKNHKFASNVFAFLQSQTMPNIWFKQFNLDEKNNIVQLSGESDDMDGFSRQVNTLENSDNKKYIKSIGTLNSSLGESTRVSFNINLVLEKSIFDYIAVASTVPENAILESQTVNPGVQPAPVNSTGTTGAGTALNEQQNTATKSSEKLITSFHILSVPEVVGVVDETNYSVVASVPYGTDVKNLTPSIVISTGSTIVPASGLSQDFTEPVIYMVTAEDGSARSYKVTVNFLPQTSGKNNQSQLIIWISIIAVVIIIIIIAIAGFIFWRNKRNQ